MKQSMYSAFNNKYTDTLQLKVIKLSLESLCLLIEYVLSIYKAQQHTHLHTCTNRKSSYYGEVNASIIMRVNKAIVAKPPCLGDAVGKIFKILLYW